MQTNKLQYQYDPLCRIIPIEEMTTTDNYVVACVLDTSKHPSFSLQLINTGLTNTLVYKIETTFDGVVFSEIKAATDILKNENAIIEDESIGTKTIISVKSKLSSTPTTFKMFARLKPASFIV